MVKMKNVIHILLGSYCGTHELQKVNITATERLLCMRGAVRSLDGLASSTLMFEVRSWCTFKEIVIDIGRNICGMIFHLEIDNYKNFKKLLFNFGKNVDVNRVFWFLWYFIFNV